ncbi:MAG: hypothetical protein ACTSY1_04765 [Alphaproteobacteria bacterium]
MRRAKLGLTDEMSKGADNISSVMYPTSASNALDTALAPKILLSTVLLLICP